MKGESIELQPELDHLPLPSDIVDAVASKTLWRKAEDSLQLCMMSALSLHIEVFS